jgi:hypothetical protein
MKLTIPEALQQEHEALHEHLRHATGAIGKVGEAAQALARLMHPHMAKEEQFALPPLGVLGALSHGEFDASMADVLAVTDRLEAELPAMLEEHRQITAALQRLHDAAQHAIRADIAQFTLQAMHHARVEEQVMYPAARLVGRHLKLLIAQRAGPQVSR